MDQQLSWWNRAHNEFYLYGLRRHFAANAKWLKKKNTKGTKNLSHIRYVLHNDENFKRYREILNFNGEPDGGYEEMNLWVYGQLKMKSK